MTKRDYQAVLSGIDKKLTENYSDADLGVYVCDKYETIRHALKLAAIVTGEPSEGVVEAGAREYCSNDAKKAGKKASDMAWKAHAIDMPDTFKAMISEAQRQAEGV